MLFRWSPSYTQIELSQYRIIKTIWSFISQNFSYRSTEFEVGNQSYQRWSYIYNNSNIPQTPVYAQLHYALYKFSSDRNASS